MRVEHKPLELSTLSQHPHTVARNIVKVKPETYIFQNFKAFFLLATFSPPTPNKFRATSNDHDYKVSILLALH